MVLETFTPLRHKMSRSFPGVEPNSERTPSASLDNLDGPRAELRVSGLLGTTTVPPDLDDLEFDQEDTCQTTYSWSCKEQQRILSLQHVLRADLAR